MARPPATFEPDSALVDIVAPGRGYKRGKLLPRAESEYRGIVYHTTGRGVERRFKREAKRRGWQKLLESALHIYGRLMDPSGHYVIDQEGTIAQVVPENLCAWHVGGKLANLYWSRPGRWWRRKVHKFDWWRRRWPGLSTPRELAGGTAWDPYLKPPGLLQRLRHPRSWARGSVNAGFVAFEVIPPEGNPSGEWSDACWRSVALLSLCVSRRRRFQLRRDTAITHSDAHPLSRTTRNGIPWDTVERQFSYERLEAEIAKLAA
jgi:hypothetical protein